MLALKYWSITCHPITLVCDRCFNDQCHSRQPSLTAAKQESLFHRVMAKARPPTLPIVYNQSKGKSILSIMKNCGNSFHHSTNKAAGKLILAPETFKCLGRQDITLVTDHGTGTLSTAEHMASFPCPKVSEL